MIKVFEENIITKSPPVDFLQTKLELMGVKKVRSKILVVLLLVIISVLIFSQCPEKIFISDKWMTISTSDRLIEDLNNSFIAKKGEYTLYGIGSEFDSGGNGGGFGGNNDWSEIGKGIMIGIGTEIIIRLIEILFPKK